MLTDLNARALQALRERQASGPSTRPSAAETAPPAVQSREAPAGVTVEIGQYTYTERREERLVYAAPATPPVAERPGAEQVANTIVSFVEERIEQERRAGASGERLDALLDEAREGVDRGYREALAELKDRGLLTEALEADIRDGRERVDRGLNALDRRLSGLEGTEQPAAPQPNPSTPSAPKGEGDAVAPRRDRQPARTPTVPELARSPASAAVQRAEASYLRYSEASVDIQIRTRDGDLVTLRARQADGEAGYVGLRSDGGQAVAEAGYGRFQSGGYEFEVQGELDEDEMRALEDLVGRVDALATRFFADDFTAAFDAALKLTADPREIASYAISLSSRQIETYETGYARSGPRANSDYAPLGDQAARVREALVPASRLVDGAAVLQEVLGVFLVGRGGSEGVVGQYLEFTRQLTEAFGLRGQAR